MFYKKTITVVSQPRLDVYRQAGHDDLDVLSNYLWNIKLCESLYPSLQHLEVGLRNSLHLALSNRFGGPRWFDSASWLDPRGAQNITDAKTALANEGKPNDPGRIVAELGFGFWTSLFNKNYEHGQILWPHLLSQVFPHMPRSIRTRAVASRSMNRIRDLRNRIFHHERVTHHPLNDLHKEILAACLWLSPQLHCMVGLTDRFPEIYRQSWIPIKQAMEKHPDVLFPK